MAWCAILWKAIKVRRAFNKLKAAKRNAYRKSLGLAPIYPLYQRPFRWVGGKLKTICLNTCCRCCKLRSGAKYSNWDKLWVNGTLPNEILKGVVGFLVGLIFSKLLLDFLISQLNFHSHIITGFCIIFGIVLTFGLTFSDTIRCLFILGIPQFFNSKGRIAILAYVMVVAMSGPGKNTAMNMEVLTETLVCGQDMVKNSTSDLVELAKEPFSVLKNAIVAIISSIQDVLERMNTELQGVIKTIYEIVNVIRQAYAMLKSIVNMCNKKLGTPFDRCMSSFEQASQDCAKELGSAFEFMCFVVDVFQNVCYFAKVTDVFCWLPSLVKQAIFEPLKEHFKIFANGFKQFFDVRLNITYAFDHDLQQDKTLGEIARNMKAEIMGHVQWFLDYVDCMDLTVSFFMLLVVWKAFTYRYKFLNSESFDNFYITRGMIRIDLERRRVGVDSVFPLRYRETKLYVETFSWNMVQEERRKMLVSLFMVGLAGIQILSYVVMDYLLYAFLELIREHGGFQIDTKEALGMAVTIEGEGFLAAMYRSILEGLSPVGGILPSFDTEKCLPVPHKPNYHQYFLILFLLLLCAIVAISEPYGLRLRHIVCGWIYPERIIPRERWLYVHILSSRDTFLVFVRRQIRAKMKGDSSVFRVSFMDRLAHTLPFCNRLFKSHKKKCFHCGRPGDEEDFEFFIECPNCHTVYCKECFNDMNQMCTACRNPIDYGDLTDVSEELGSDSDSDSEPDLIQRCCTRMCKKSKKSKTKSFRNSESKTSTKDKRRSETQRKYENVKYQKLDESRQTTKNQSSKVSKQSSKISRREPISQSNPKASLRTKTKTKPAVASSTKDVKNSATNHHSGWMSMAFRSLTSKFSGNKSNLKNVSSSYLKQSKEGFKILKDKSSSGIGSKQLNRSGYKRLNNSDEASGSANKFRDSGTKSASRATISNSKTKSSSKKSVGTTRSKNEEKLQKQRNNFRKYDDEETHTTKHQLQSKSQSKSKRSVMYQELQKDESKEEYLPNKSSHYYEIATPISSRKSPSVQKTKSKMGNSNVQAHGNTSKSKNKSESVLYKELQKDESKEGYLSKKSSHYEIATPSSSRKPVSIHKTKSKMENFDVHSQGYTSNSSDSHSSLNPGQFSPRNISRNDYNVHSTSSTIYIEEIDGQDVNGICYHHQQVEPQTVAKYNQVLSELHAIYPEIAYGGCENDTNTNEETEKRTNFALPHIKDAEEGCKKCSEPTTFPYSHERQMNPEKNQWLNRNWDSHTLQNETFGKARKVSSGLRERVDMLNEFYDKMPYPPHCNL